MFFKIGIKALVKRRSFFFFSVVMIALGASMLFAMNIMTDQLQAGMVAKTNFVFGNVDYTVYRDDYTTIGKSDVYSFPLVPDEFK